MGLGSRKRLSEERMRKAVRSGVHFTPLSVEKGTFTVKKRNKTSHKMKLS